MAIRILTVLAGLIALLATVACLDPLEVTKQAYDNQVEKAQEEDLKEGFDYRWEIESPLALTSVAVGLATSCGLRSDGSTVCWGFDEAYRGL